MYEVQKSFHYQFLKMNGFRTNKSRKHIPYVWFSQEEYVNKCGTIQSTVSGSGKKNSFVYCWNSKYRSLKKEKKNKLVPVWFRVYCYSINNLSYAEGTTLVAESEEEL